MNNRPTNTHTIRLRPIGKYFFGGETHHELDSRRQYFHRSNPYPQQTSLLGMVRHQLLLQHGLIPLHEGQNAEAAIDLIGANGFDGQSDHFGVIASISPIRWLNHDHVFDQRLFDWLQTEEGIQKPILDWDSQAKSASGTLPSVPKIKYLKKGKEEPWTAKVPFSTQLQHCHDEEGPMICHMPMDRVVHESEQVGIHKDREGKPKEEGYFKFVYKRLEEGWSFVFQVTFFNESESGRPFKFDSTKRVITMGAERSAFELEVLTNPVSFPATQVAEDGQMQKVVLISDAYVPSEEGFYQLTDLPLCTSTPFRYNVSHIKKEKHNYYGLPVRSQRYHLLKRGSVFYTRQAEKLTDMLKGETAFYSIGYNHYLIENP